MTWKTTSRDLKPMHKWLILSNEQKKVSEAQRKCPFDTPDVILSRLLKRILVPASNSIEYFYIIFSRLAQISSYTTFDIHCNRASLQDQDRFVSLISSTVVIGRSPVYPPPPLLGPRVEPPCRVESGWERNALGCSIDCRRSTLQLAHYGQQWSIFTPQ